MGVAVAAAVGVRQRPQSAVGFQPNGVKSGAGEITIMGIIDQ